MVVIIHPQNMTNFRVQFLHIIAVTLLPKFPKTAQVLPDLGGSDIHLLPQRVRGNTYHSPGTEFCQLPVIAGQPPNYGIGDIFFLQNAHSQSEPCHNDYSLA